MLRWLLGPPPVQRSSFLMYRLIASTVNLCSIVHVEKFWSVPSDYLTTIPVQQQPYLNLLPFLNFPRPLLRIPYVIYSFDYFVVLSSPSIVRIKDYVK